MNIVWDEPKRQTNIEKHFGLDFADLDMNYFEQAVIGPAREGRLKAIGLFRGDLLSVIFAALGSEAISIVSMRLASQEERVLYEQHQ